MTVAELIELLKTMPQDVLVVALNGPEEMRQVTATGVAVVRNDRFHIRRDDPEDTEYVEIIGA